MEYSRNTSIENRFKLSVDLCKATPTKDLKRFISRDYGFVIESNDRTVIYAKFLEANKCFFENLEKFVLLIEALYSEKPKNISNVKDEIESLLGIKFSARDKYELNKKMINLIQCKINYNVISDEQPCLSNKNYYKKYYFQILKYQSFISSSKLENVFLKYSSISKEDLDNKYSRFLEEHHG